MSDKKTDIVEEMNQSQDATSDNSCQGINLKEKKVAPKKKIIIVATFVVLFVVFAVIIYPKVIAPSINYKEAISLLEDGKWQEAEAIFSELGDYKDSKLKVAECNILQADELVADGNYEAALDIYAKNVDFKGVQKKYDACCAAIYEDAKNNFNNNNYKTALSKFNKIKNYSDSQSWIAKCEEGIAAAEAEKKKAYQDSGLCGTWILKKQSVDYETEKVMKTDFYDIKPQWAGTVEFKDDGTAIVKNYKNEIVVEFEWEPTDNVLFIWKNGNRSGKFAFYSDPCVELCPSIIESANPTSYCNNLYYKQ